MHTESSENYIGNELELFEKATHWKKYWSSQLKPFIQGNVLEVGAGLGGSTTVLTQVSEFDSWTCLEPDMSLLVQIEKKIDQKQLSSSVTCLLGTLDAVPSSQRFDTILYIDVLEHIEKDLEELQKAAAYLTENGRVIVLAPAHNIFFSPFDKAIGHYRRYNKTLMQQCTPANLQFEQVKYLDSLGMLLSFANKLFLRQKMPTVQQIAFWDGTIVPISRTLDPLLGFHWGKTIIGIWRKPSEKYVAL